MTLRVLTGASRPLFSSPQVIASAEDWTASPALSRVRSALVPLFLDLTGWDPPAVTAALKALRFNPVFQGLKVSFASSLVASVESEERAAALEEVLRHNTALLLVTAPDAGGGIAALGGSAEWARALCALGSNPCPRIAHLDLRGCGVTRAAAAALAAALSRLPPASFAVLLLGNTHLDDVGTTAVLGALVRHAPSLEVLDLSGATVPAGGGGPAGEALGALLAAAPRLRRLELRKSLLIPTPGAPLSVPSLEALAIGAPATTATVAFVAAVAASAKGLKEVSLPGAFDAAYGAAAPGAPPPSGNDSGALAAVLDALKGSALVQVDFSGCPKAAQQALVAVLASGAHPGRLGARGCALGDAGVTAAAAAAAQGRKLLGLDLSCNVASVDPAAPHFAEFIPRHWEAFAERIASLRDGPGGPPSAVAEYGRAADEAFQSVRRGHSAEEHRRSRRRRPRRRRRACVSAPRRPSLT